MKKRNWIFGIALAVSLGWMACDDDDDDFLGGPELNDDDEAFVEWAAQSNMAEIQLSEMAVDSATDSLAIQFAQEMIDDHSSAQDELQAIADDFSDVDWPDELSDDQKAMRDQLDSATGFTFDSLYMAMQIQMHDQAISEYQARGTTASDAQVNAYATSHLTILQEHRTRADSILTAMKTAQEQGQDGTTGDGTTGDGTTGDGTTGDGTTGDGSTDDGTSDGGTGTYGRAG